MRTSAWRFSHGDFARVTKPNYGWLYWPKSDIKINHDYVRKTIFVLEQFDASYKQAHGALLYDLQYGPVLHCKDPHDHIQCSQVGCNHCHRLRQCGLYYIARMWKQLTSRYNKANRTVTVEVTLSADACWRRRRCRRRRCTGQMQRVVRTRLMNMQISWGF